MKISKDIDLPQFSYMKIGGKGKFLAELEDEKDIPELIRFQQKENIPIIILGEGSNTIFKDKDYNNIFVKINFKDLLKTYEDHSAINIEAEAGMNWDKLVNWTVDNNLSGLENLSGIPGTVGACPIQNIGAYGWEVSDTITFVKIYEFESKKFYEVPNKDCQFGYRKSIFKENLNKFLITRVGFRLSKQNPPKPQYKDLSIYFVGKEKPTLSEIRKAVLEIRSGKLPDPKKSPNCGSFFKNPIVDNKKIKELNSKFTNMPQFKVSDKEVKLSGGWLIENIGLKGKKIGNISISEKNALVLISNEKANYSDLERVKNTIIEKVNEKFGIILEIEPNIID